MCCFIDGSPVQDKKGRMKTFDGPNKFQTSMMKAPCAECPKSCCWFWWQFFPYTCACTQYALRYKALGGDMTRYSCFQGYFNCCCIKAGAMGEQKCPELCLFAEACCCNGLAVSATRAMVLDQYQLSMEPCDYRLIRISNCLQCLSCLCDILAMIDGSFREIARIIDIIAGIVYHTVSGCMTAQVAHEINYQLSLGNNGFANKVNPQNYAPQPQNPQSGYAAQQPQNFAPQPNYAQPSYPTAQNPAPAQAYAYPPQAAAR